MPALQVRGYGDSDKPEEVEAYAVTALADDVAAAIAALSPDDTAHVVGHDWGAVIVQAAGLIHPERFRSLATLSVPTFLHAPAKPSEVWPKLYADCLFYQAYFQAPGVAEAEFGGDIARFLRVFFLSPSGECDPANTALFRPKGATRLLDGLPDPGASLPAWLAPADLAFYAESFRRGGLTGPLNRYRCADLDWTLMQPYAARRLAMPGLFIAGLQEPTRFMVPGKNRFDDPVPRMDDCRRVHLILGAGHWVQQGAADEVCARLIAFLRGVEAGAPSGVTDAAVRRT